MIEQNGEIWSGNGWTNGRHGYGTDDDDDDDDDYDYDYDFDYDRVSDQNL